MLVTTPASEESSVIVMLYLTGPREHKIIIFLHLEANIVPQPKETHTDIEAQLRGTYIHCHPIMLSQACFLCIVTQLVEGMCIQHESAHNEFLILLDKQVSSVKCFFTLKGNKAESQTFKDYYETVRTSEICLKTASLCAVCDCKNGVCNKGPEGDGECLCQPPYTGKNCDQGKIIPQRNILY